MTEAAAGPGPTGTPAYVCNATAVTITSVTIGTSVVGQNLAPMSVSAAACSMPGDAFTYPSSPFTITVVFANGGNVCRTVQAGASASMMLIVAMLNGLLVSTGDGRAKELLFTSGSAALVLLDRQEGAS